jgi:hypothetical protein
MSCHSHFFVHHLLFPQMELIRVINPKYETDGTFKWVEHRTMNGEVPWNLPSDLIIHAPGITLFAKCLHILVGP